MIKWDYQRRHKSYGMQSLWGVIWIHFVLATSLINYSTNSLINRSERLLYNGTLVVVLKMSTLSDRELDALKDAMELYDTVGDGKVDSMSLADVLRGIGENPTESAKSSGTGICWLFASIRSRRLWEYKQRRVTTSVDNAGWQIVHRGCRYAYNRTWAQRTSQLWRFREKCDVCINTNQVSAEFQRK